jgi:hypothetical protein
MAHTKLSDFLDRLAGDTTLQDRYLKHQKQMLKDESGLSQEHQDTLLAGDLGAIRDAVQTEVGGSTRVFGCIKGVIK